MFYKAIVQSVLLFGVETWTLTESMLKCLQGFHHRVARQLSGLTASRLPHGAWQHHPAADALKTCGMYSMEEYINRRCKYLDRYITERPILALCRGAPYLSGTPTGKIYWWYREQFADGNIIVDL